MKHALTTTTVLLLLVPALAGRATAQATDAAAPAPAGANAGAAPPAGAGQAPPSPDAQRRQGPNAGPNVDREQMWFAPTAEDWKKPCLVRFERTMEDAIAVAKETRKPILVCVNMDGEIASEHYAGVRYRRPETAKLYDPYVCVIASVYRHVPRDHDEEGNRIPCPRFGSVTCGEHIAIEPGLYDKYFDGKRIAPRHIGVELEKQGAEMYDVYYAWDTDTIFRSLEEGIAERGIEPIRVVREDRPIEQRVASRAREDREAVEAAYRAGDRGARRALLERAASHPEIAHVELLRLAIYGLDVELAGVARRALAQTNAPEAVDLIGEALRVPLAAPEKEALVAALERLGASSPRARTLATVHRGLAREAKALDVGAWRRALASSAASADAPESLAARAGEAERRAGEAPGLLELAASTLELALDPATEPRYAKLLLEDARSSALEAESRGERGWLVDAAIALADERLGRREDALARIEAAVAAMPADAPPRTAARALALFADARWQSIRRALLAKEPWDPQWLADMHAAYDVLAGHPYGQDGEVATHHELLRWLGAHAEADRVLDDGLARFPGSWALHEQLRARVLRERGAAGLEPEYRRRLEAVGASPLVEWYAGYAAFVAAEYQRRAGDLDGALASYERVIAHYDRAAEALPDERTNADHYVALALAARARVAFEQGDDARALDELLASFARRPESAAGRDGLNLSPVDTAKVLLARLQQAGDAERAARLTQALRDLEALDPELLRLPAFERETPGGPSPDALRRGRRR